MSEETKWELRARRAEEEVAEAEKTAGELLLREYQLQQQVKVLHRAVDKVKQLLVGSDYGPAGESYDILNTALDRALSVTSAPVEETAKDWECCEVCNRMYRSGETCVDCPGFAEPVNTYLQRPETQAVCLCVVLIKAQDASYEAMMTLCERCIHSVFAEKLGHSSDCTVPGCGGSSALTPVEELNDEI